jgi:hypothetical protein
MAIYRRGGIWWFEFSFQGQRIRESAMTSSKTIAREAERARRRELELGIMGSMGLRSASDRHCSPKRQRTGSRRSWHCRRSGYATIVSTSASSRAISRTGC